MGYFKLTHESDLELDKASNSDHDVITILFQRPPDSDNIIFTYIHSTNKYATFIRDSLRCKKRIRIRQISRKNLESETKDLKPYQPTYSLPTHIPIPNYIPSYLETLFDRHQDAIDKYINKKPPTFYQTTISIKS